MDGLSNPAIGEITDIPFPAVEVRQVADPLPAIVQSSEFAETVRFFETTVTAPRTLAPPVAQAVIYSVTRNVLPHHVVEIGTFKGGTTETLARALLANGFGTLHTGSPHDAARFLPIYHAWPNELRRQVRYYQVDSMALFMRLDFQRLRPDIVVVDGNHNFEFASFDIEAAARRVSRGGFIFINSISQAGPYFAATDFLRAHPEWHSCGVMPSETRDDMRAVDRSRTGIDQGDLMVLRAPFEHYVVARPESRGEIQWANRPVSGVRLFLDKPQFGTLFVQCVMRGCSDARTTEVTVETEKAIDGKTGTIDVTFAPALSADGGMDRYFVEPWLAWQGETPLKLAHEIDLF
jgi:Methyltransferase domain